MKGIQYINEYVEDKKILYEAILSFLDSPNEGNNCFEQIQEMIQDQQYEEEKSDFEHFLQLILNLSNNHYRSENFHEKIEQILDVCLETIQNTFSKSEIFYFFKSSKQILHFLFRTKILEVDESIYRYLNEKKDMRLFFYPEIKEFIDNEKIEKIESELISENSSILDNFEEKRLNGENERYICSLIRQDAVEEFVAYVNKTNIKLSSEIEPSIFETNSFLNKNNSTLIEYAAFFGSFQILKYLEMNGVKLEPSLWLYTIHGRNAELFHHLESSKVPPPNGGYEKCFSESIKCHHNEFAAYIENNFLQNANEETSNIILSKILHYRNYSNFPIEIIREYDKNIFFYMCLYNYINLVESFLYDKEEYIKEIIIRKHNLSSGLFRVNSSNLILSI